MEEWRVELDAAGGPAVPLAETRSTCGACVLKATRHLSKKSMTTEFVDAEEVKLAFKQSSESLARSGKEDLPVTLQGKFPQIVEKCQ